MKRQRTRLGFLLRAGAMLLALGLAAAGGARFGAATPPRAETAPPAPVPVATAEPAAQPPTAGAPASDFLQAQNELLRASVKVLEEELRQAASEPRSEAEEGSAPFDPRTFDPARAMAEAREREQRLAWTLEDRFAADPYDDRRSHSLRGELEGHVAEGGALHGTEIVSAACGRGICRTELVFPDEAESARLLGILPFLLPVTDGVTTILPDERDPRRVRVFSEEGEEERAADRHPGA